MHPFTPITELTAKVVSCGSTEERIEGETSGRVIHTLRSPDGEEVAAGTLYHRWCEEYVQKNLMPPPEVADGPGAFNPAVLGASTLCPLGVPVAREGDDAFDYRMMHPSGIYYFAGQQDAEQKAYLKNFASVETGKSDVVLFKANRGDLLSGLKKLKEQLCTQMDRAGGGGIDSVALSTDALHERLAGVLMVYCAGCMMSINSGKDGSEQMRRLTGQLSSCFAGRPFHAFHPFGETGFYPSKQVNHHSNLMFSALAFSKDPAFEVDETRSFTSAMKPIIQKFSGGVSDQTVSQVLEHLLAFGDKANFEALFIIAKSREISAAWEISERDCMLKAVPTIAQDPKLGLRQWIPHSGVVPGYSCLVNPFLLFLRVFAPAATATPYSTSRTPPFACGANFTYSWFRVWLTF